MRDLKLQRLFKGFNHSFTEDQKSKTTVISNEFEGIECLFFEER